MTRFSDLMDANASPNPKQAGWLEFGRVLAPSMVAYVLPFAGPAWNILSGTPELQRWLRLAAPAAAFAVCWAVIGARGQASKFGFAAGPQTYRYSQPGRRTAKICLLPLIALLCWQFVVLGPNAVFRRRAFGGYLCDAGSHKAFSRPAQIEFVDAAGQTASAAPAGTDDTGYFAAELRPWASSPARIRVSSSCGGMTLPVDTAASTTTGCPAETRTAPPRGTSGVWEFLCSK